MGAGDAGDEAAHAEPAQIVGDLSGGDRCRGDPAQAGDQRAQVLVGEPARLQSEHWQRGEQGMAALFTEA